MFIKKRRIIVGYSLAIYGYIIMAVLTGVFLIFNVSQYEDCGSSYGIESIVITFFELFVFSVISIFLVKFFFVNYSEGVIMIGYAVLSLLLFLITTLPVIKGSYGYNFSERFFAGLFNVSAYHLIFCALLNSCGIELNCWLMICAYIFVFVIVFVGIYLWNFIFPAKKAHLVLPGDY